LGAAVALAAGPAQAQPRLVCAEPTFLFRPQANTGSVSHVFRLANAGTEPLMIGRVRSDCGCLLARLDRARLAPGEAAVLEARFSLRGRSGLQHKRITLESNDPVRPQWVLSLIGEAVAEAQLEPARLFWGNVPCHARATRQAVLRFDARTPASVRSARVEAPGFEVSWRTNRPGCEYRFEIRTMPPLAPGRVDTRLVIESDHARQAVITAPLSGRVVGEVYAVPDELRISPGAAPSARLMRIQAADGRPFAIRGVDVPRTNITVEVKPALGGGYRLTLRGIPGDPALEGGILAIQTDREALPVLSVPFRVAPPEAP